MAFKIFVTDGGSTISAALLGAFSDLGHLLIHPDLPRESWCDSECVTALLKESAPAILINTLQISDIDASIDSPNCYRVLSEVCVQLNIPVIHISSHEVFSPSQQQGEAMKEGDTPIPDTTRGEVFFAAELAFLNNPQCMVLRVPWVVDLPGGALDSVLKPLAYSKRVKASDEWVGCFVTLDDIVRTTVAISQQILCNSKNWGLAHIRTSDRCTELEFVDYLQRVLDKEGCRTAAVGIAEPGEFLFDTNGWLAGTMCTDGFGVQFLSWRQGLKVKVIQWLEREVEAGRIKSNKPA